MNKKTTFAAIKLMYVSYFSLTNIFCQSDFFFYVKAFFLFHVHISGLLIWMIFPFVIRMHIAHAPLHTSHMRNKRLSIDFGFFSFEISDQ